MSSRALRRAQKGKEIELETAEISSGDEENLIENRNSNGKNKNLFQTIK